MKKKLFGDTSFDLQNHIFLVLPNILLESTSTSKRGHKATITLKV